MFEVITKQRKVVYIGTRKACWRYCELHDIYATCKIKKHE